MAGKPGSDDKEKFLYLTQIKHLDEQLERCQLKYDSLKSQNKGLVRLHRALEEDSADIRECLKHCVAVQQKQVEQLRSQLTQQQQAAAQAREALQLQHRRHEQQLQEHMDKQTADSRRQGLVLQQQEEQQEEQLTERMQRSPAGTSLEEQLAKQQEKYKDAIHSLQQEARLERARLIKQRQKTLDAMKSKTREEERTRQREQMEFQELLLRNKVLWEQKEVLEETEERLSRHVDQLRTDLDKLNQEASSSRKKVEQLRKQIQQQEEEVKDTRLSIERLQEVKENERLLLASESDKCRQKSVEADRLRAELQAESDVTRQLEGAVQEAAIILRFVLKHDSGKVSGKQRERLVELLQSPHPQGTASTVHSTETQNLATDPLLLMACYRPGDLGLVPRPTWKHRAALSRRLPALPTGPLRLRSSMDQTQEPRPQQTNPVHSPHRRTSVASILPVLPALCP